MLWLLCRENIMVDFVDFKTDYRRFIFELKAFTMIQINLASQYVYFLSMPGIYSTAFLSFSIHIFIPPHSSYIFSGILKGFFFRLHECWYSVFKWVQHNNYCAVVHSTVQHFSSSDNLCCFLLINSIILLHSLINHRPHDHTIWQNLSYLYHFITYLTCSTIFLPIILFNIIKIVPKISANIFVNMILTAHPLSPYNLLSLKNKYFEIVFYWK